MKPNLDLRAKSWVSTAMASSFFNRGPKPFNILPRELRDPKWLCVEPTKLNIANFIDEVDEFSMKVSNQPKDYDCKKERKSLTNSIFDQVRHMNAN